MADEQTTRSQPDPLCPGCNGRGFISSYNSSSQSLAYWCSCAEAARREAEFDWLKSIQEASL